MRLTEKEQTKLYEVPIGAKSKGFFAATSGPLMLLHVIMSR